MSEIIVGTASWTDKTLIASGAFYPKQATNAKERLAFYARHFKTVEVDSTYYALPSERNAGLWAQRTPPGFVFHVKAYSMLTGHPTLVRGIPRQLVEQIPKDILKRDQQRDFPQDVVDAAFRMFSSALAPLREAGKLGCLLFQFPPWFVPGPDAYRRLQLVRERLPDDRIAVEFRNWRWVSAEEQEESLRFLRDNAMTYVIVDAPWVRGWEGPVAVTAPVAYVRFHGRNRATWFNKGVETVQRYRYLYGLSELAGWATRIKDKAGEAQQCFVLFNNCYEDYAVRNARMFEGLIHVE